MHWRSRLVQPQQLAPRGFKSLAVPTCRGSTVLFERQADVRDSWDQYDDHYTYGLYGTPTALELGARIAQLESALHTFVVPGGQSAIALVYLALCSAGSHVLIPHSAYGPNRELADGTLRRLSIEVEPYDPLIGAGIGELMKPNTAFVWTESPGSVTMEIQDVPAICAAAHAKNVPVALDNTYAAGVLFDAFRHGVDISVQALTKYVGGHSDLLLGTMSVREAKFKERIGETLREIGMAVSPDDCNLALRGLQTLGVRLDYLQRSTLRVAQWLAEQPAVATVFHPALPSCPGHDVWKRDFKGSASVFSVLFNKEFSSEQVEAFIDSLSLFKIGFSWGGTTSLALAYPNLNRPDPSRYSGRLVRLNIGLEHTDDLIADLKQALERLAGISSA
jgi:cystathionine beta-lyase